MAAAWLGGVLRNVYITPLLELKIGASVILEDELLDINHCNLLRILSFPTRPAAMNSTYIDVSFCTYANCSVVDYGQLQYIPSLPGNAFYLSVFALAVVAQTALGVWHRTWGFMVGMLGGLALEILGYVARIQLHYNDFERTHFIIYLVGLTIGPACFSGAIYICLARIINIYGTAVSLLSPRTITSTFICCDFFSLVLQAGGGALTALDISPSLGQTGVNIMIAGLASQVASMTAFGCICLQIMYTVRKSPGKVNRNSTALRWKVQFRVFLYGKKSQGSLCLHAPD